MRADDRRVRTGIIVDPTEVEYGDDSYPFELIVRFISMYNTLGADRGGNIFSFALVETRQITVRQV